MANVSLIDETYHYTVGPAKDDEITHEEERQHKFYPQSRVFKSSRSEVEVGSQAGSSRVLPIPDNKFPRLWILGQNGPSSASLFVFRTGIPPHIRVFAHRNFR